MKYYLALIRNYTWICAAMWINREIFVSKAHRQWANPEIENRIVSVRGRGRWKIGEHRVTLGMVAMF